LILKKLVLCRQKVRLASIVLLAASFVVGSGNLIVQAARKYYPPGFNPSTLKKEEIPVSLPSKVEPPPAPSESTTVVKTIVIKSLVPVMVPAKPKDALTVLMESHRYYEALHLVEGRLKKSPQNYDLMLTRGFLLREQGQYVASIEQFESLLAKNPPLAVRAASWNALGWSCYEKALQDKQGNVDSTEPYILQAAQDAFQQSINLKPNQPCPWAGLARTELAEGHLKQAQAALDRAMKIKSTDLAVTLARADIMLYQKRYDEAIQLLNAAKTPTSSNPDLYLFLARALLSRSKPDDAIINLKQLLELEPNHTEALKLISQAYSVKMKPENASQTLETAIDLNPKDVDSVFNLLQLYDSRGEQEKAVARLETLLKADPYQIDYLGAYLDRLIQKNRWRSAYEKGMSALPDLLKSQTIPSASADQLVPVVSEFAEAFYYYKARITLDRLPLNKLATIQQVNNFTRLHQANLLKQKPDIAHATSLQIHLWLEDQRTLLYLNPLEKTKNLAAIPIPDDDLYLALQIAYLSGERDTYQRFLERAKRLPISQDASISKGLPEVARQLYSAGDYEGASELITILLLKRPNLEPFVTIQQDIQDSVHDVAQQELALKILARRIRPSYWDKLAGQTLKASNGDAQLHRLLAESLLKQRRFNLASQQRQLAKRFATNSDDD
jgi:uncharacterized protein HemY